MRGTCLGQPTVCPVQASLASVWSRGVCLCVLCPVLPGWSLNRGHKKPQAACIQSPCKTLLSIIISTSSAHPPHTLRHTGHASHHDMPMDPIQKKVAELSIVTSGTPMVDRGVIHPGIVNIRGKQGSKARQADRHGIERSMHKRSTRAMSREGGERRDGERLNCKSEMERVAAASWSSTHGAVPRGAPGKQAFYGRRVRDGHIASTLNKDQSMTHSLPSTHTYIYP